MVVLHRRSNKLGLSLGTVSLAVYAAVAALVTGPAHTWWWVGAYLLCWALYLGLFLGREDKDWAASPWVIIGWALAARLVLVTSEIWLSDDIYRYLLDGRVLAAGINPFRYAPDDPHVIAIAPDLAALVNHADVPTIYPPTVQAIGWVAAKLNLGVVGWRLLMSIVDLATMVAVSRLFGRGSRGWRAAAIYGLCPLAIFESGANGHLEPLTLLFLVWGVHWMECRRPWRAGLGFGLAIGAKYFPLLLLPIWWRERGAWKLFVLAVAIPALTLWPFTFGGVDVTQGLRTYLANWSFNSPFYALLESSGINQFVLRAIPFAAVGLGAVVTGWRRSRALTVIPLLLFAFLVLGPTLHPWYALWVLPWLGSRPHPGHWAFVGAMGGAYSVWWSVVRHDSWELPDGVGLAIWGIVATGWLLASWSERGQTAQPVS